MALKKVDDTGVRHESHLLVQASGSCASICSPARRGCDHLPDNPGLPRGTAPWTGTHSCGGPGPTCARPSASRPRPQACECPHRRLIPSLARRTRRQPLLVPALQSGEFWSGVIRVIIFAAIQIPVSQGKDGECVCLLTVPGGVFMAWWAAQQPHRALAKAFASEQRYEPRQDTDSGERSADLEGDAARIMPDQGTFNSLRY